MCRNQEVSTHRSNEYVFLGYQMFCKLLYDDLDKSLLLNAVQYFFTPFIRSIFIHLCEKDIFLKSIQRLMYKVSQPLRQH